MGQRMELGRGGARIQQIWAQWPHRMQGAKKLSSSGVCPRPPVAKTSLDISPLRNPE